MQALTHKPFSVCSISQAYFCIYSWMQKRRGRSRPES